jgi:ApaG protein
MDGEARIQEVRGDGVVGEQPHLAPGESFDYTSACPLQTPFGTMEGSYNFVADNGDEFDAPIPLFMLAVPSALN